MCTQRFPAILIPRRPKSVAANLAAMVGVAGPPSTAPHYAPPCRSLRRTKAAVAFATATPPSSTLAAVRPSVAAAGRGQLPWLCRARRRVRYGGGHEEDEEQGHNPELAMVESFSVAAKGQAFLIQATVDGEEETALVFRGFSSLLSSGTSADLARSVLPARAVMRSVDVVRGPFDPTNIEYLEKGLPWEEFKARLMA